MVDNKLSTTPPLQIIVCDWYQQEVPGAPGRERAPFMPVYLQDIDPLIEKLDHWVPNPDYDGRWLEDYKEAKFISFRLKRPLFICFTSMDGSEYTQKFFDEVFLTPVFKDYVKKNIVL